MRAGVDQDRVDFSGIAMKDVRPTDFATRFFFPEFGSHVAFRFDDRPEMVADGRHTRSARESASHPPQLRVRKDPLGSSGRTAADGRSLVDPTARGELTTKRHRRLWAEIDHVGLARPILTTNEIDLALGKPGIDVLRADLRLAPIEMRGCRHVADDKGGATMS